MAELATIARPYAKALFELASEKGQIEFWLEKLKDLAWAVGQRCRYCPSSEGRYPNWIIRRYPHATAYGF